MTKAKRLTILAVCVVASVTLLNATGVAGSWGSQLDAGGAQEEIDSIEQEGRDINVESKPNDDFGLVDGVRSAVDAFTTALVLPSVLLSLGVPAPIVAFVTAPIVLILIYGLISVVRGFRL
jgi:hypothetical protein